MKLCDIINMKPGTRFLYKGQPAEVKWDDHTKFSIGIFKDKETKQDKEIFWRSSSIFFKTEDLKEGITLTTCLPQADFKDPNYEFIS